jgi:hypothetical protein
MVGMRTSMAIAGQSPWSVVVVKDAIRLEHPAGARGFLGCVQGYEQRLEQS